MGVPTSTTNVRAIKAAIDQQTFRGRGRVYIGNCQRVIGARLVKGQLQARLLSSGEWVNVESVTIE